ncbi:MAG: S-adenosylmethionine:tRNA ribosyltransferase-isomerase, partial [Thermodesulfobacteriota bacterium]
SMHSEYALIPQAACDAVNSAKKTGRRVITVGTTVVRALESSTIASGLMQPFSGFTNIFITPPYKFRFIDGLITNFHMPRSTLLMLVSAFAGKELILKAYEEAKNMNYRFLSYGDAMFIY